MNEQADYLSRVVDYDDWYINPAVFAEVDEDWGPHTVDRFADYHNHQTPRFNSRCWNPGSEAVDAFTVDWAGETNWWCPPITLVPRVIGQMLWRAQQAVSMHGACVGCAVYAVGIVRESDLMQTFRICVVTRGARTRYSEIPCGHKLQYMIMHTSCITKTLRRTRVG